MSGKLYKYVRKRDKLSTNFCTENILHIKNIYYVSNLALQYFVFKRHRNKIMFHGEKKGLGHTPNRFRETLDGYTLS